MGWMNAIGIRRREKRNNEFMLMAKAMRDSKYSAYTEPPKQNINFHKNYTWI